VQYNTGDVVEKWNVESFAQKEEAMIRARGSRFYKRREDYRRPYCKTKKKPRDGIYEHLVEHAKGASRSPHESIKSRGQHKALWKALTPA
jgi:hypothetical protein